MVSQIAITSLSPSEPARSPQLPEAPAAPSPASVVSLRRLAVPLLAITLVSGGVAIATADWNRWVAGASHQSTDDAVVGADVSTLSAQISGIVRSAPVADYQRVTKGQLLAEIDPREYDAAVAASRANLAADGRLPDRQFRPETLNRSLPLYSGDPARQRRAGAKPVEHLAATA